MSDDLDFDFGFTAVTEDELEAVQKTKTTATSAQDKLDRLYNAITPLLNNLKKIKVISYQQKHNFPTIKYLQNRKDAKYLSINEKKLEQRKNNDKSKLDDIIKYVSTNDKCRNIMLLQYLSNEKSDKNYNLNSLFLLFD